jgi:hypothetical protein
VSLDGHGTHGALYGHGQENQTTRAPVSVAGVSDHGHAGQSLLTSRSRQMLRRQSSRWPTRIISDTLRDRLVVVREDA